VHSSWDAHAALAELNKALREKPHLEGHTLSMAAHELSLLRDRIAGQQDEAGADPDSLRQLEHVNAAISVVMGAHFPLGNIPWAELEKARDWLAALADDPAGKG
jgi:hypothetical protein